MQSRPKIDSNKFLCFVNQFNDFHRKDGPAAISPSTVVYYQNGVVDRDEENGPAQITPQMIAYMKDGKPHRVNGPSYKWVDGTEFWHNENRLHRIGGPAINYVDGRPSEFWLYGQPMSEEEYWKKINQ